MSQQSFFFDWNPPNQPTPVPITAQCETLQVSWSRQTATGPDPVAPYYLQIFTSNYIFPFQIDAGSGLTTNLTIPFAPGTQYQICMFDSVGNTGGCQAVYTVYPAPDGPPTCSNFSMPASPLDVVTNFGQYSWIPSCSELTLKANSGSPPYEVTVAPALHPPYNISNVGAAGVSWKLPLQWGIPFFVSMTDSTGLSWSYGPLHAGAGEQSCLVGEIEVSLPVTVAVLVAAMTLGAVLAIILSSLWRYRQRRVDPLTQRIPKKDLLLGSIPSTYVGVPFLESPDDSRRGLLTRRSDYSLNSVSTDPEWTANPLSPHEQRAHHVRPIPLNRGMNRSVVSSLGSVYHVESFHPGEHGIVGLASPTHSRRQTQVEPMSPTLPGSPSRGASQHIYVVHHDSGPAPVSIYADDGAEIVELPPVYSRPPPPGPSTPTPTSIHPQERSSGEEDLGIQRPRLNTLNTRVPSASHSSYAPSPMRDPSFDLCTTPTGLIPPRGVPWTNDPGLPPEKSGFRQVDF